MNRPPLILIVSKEQKVSSTLDWDNCLDRLAELDLSTIARIKIYIRRKDDALSLSWYWSAK